MQADKTDERHVVDLLRDQIEFANGTAFFIDFPLNFSHLVE